MPNAGKRDVVIVTGITGYGKSSWLEKYLEGFKRIILFDPFKDLPASYIDGDKLIALHDSGTLRNAKEFRLGLFALPDVDIGGSISFLTGNCVFVIEECGYAFQKAERIPKWLSECIFLGRHKSLTLIFTAQRAVSIPIELRSQANRFISFRQTEPADVKWCRDKLGDYADELPDLPKYRCIDNDTGVVTRYDLLPPRKSSNEVAPAQGSSIIGA